MKKLILALSLGLLLPLSACGSNSGNGGQNTVFSKFDGKLENGAVLRILENDTAVKQGYLKELIAGFNEKYKEYNITAVDANMDEYSDLENDGPYGYGPDVLYQANDSIMKYVYGKHIMPIPVDRLECYSKVDQNAWNAYKSTVSGTEYTFGVPINIQASLMYYREDLLPENNDENNNGIPDMLENWSNLYKYSKEIHENNSSKYGYMKSLDDFYFASGYLFSYGGYIFGNNGKDSNDIGLSKSEADKKANDNLKQIAVPKLPASGDLNDTTGEMIDMKTMGGINGYAISSYTKYPNAALAFLDYASSYEMVKRRHEILGIATCREDLANEGDSLSKTLFTQLKDRKIEIMPSIRETSQIWTPAGTLCKDIANDPYRSISEQKYLTDDSIKNKLSEVCKQIYEAIHALQ